MKGRQGKRKTRAPVVAAGGIVLRGEGRSKIAVVQLRKMGAWVLPKGKLAGGESAIVAARREVREETGHRVATHEFLGTLAYEASGRPKLVHFWRMQAVGGPVGELMHDVKAMEWLSLDKAIERLTHAREQSFLAQVGPLALRSASRSARKSVVRRLIPASRGGTVAIPEGAPLPAREGRAVARRAGGRNVIERTLGWFRQAGQRPKPKR